MLVKEASEGNVTGKAYESNHYSVFENDIFKVTEFLKTMSKFIKRCQALYEISCYTRPHHNETGLHKSSQAITDKLCHVYTMHICNVLLLILPAGWGSINSLGIGDIYLWTQSLLVMAYCLFNTTPVLRPTLNYNLPKIPLGTNLSELWIEIQTFSFRKTPKSTWCWLLSQTA